MSISQADLFLANKASFFPQESITTIREMLATLEDEDIMILNTLDFKDPSMLLVISIVGGTFGIDRFLLGDTGMGILKLLTGGLCGILTIYDWFVVQDNCKKQNLQMLLSMV